jgi:hypothetical protein
MKKHSLSTTSSGMQDIGPPHLHQLYWNADTANSNVKKLVCGIPVTMGMTVGGSVKQRLVHPSHETNRALDMSSRDNMVEAPHNDTLPCNT